MEAWRPQRYRQIGASRGVDAAVLANAVATGRRTIAVDPALPPILTLRHLAHLAAVDYGFLRAVVARRLEDPYTVFRVRKGGTGPRRREYRVICVPDPALMQVQRWIARRVLARGKPHPASFAFAEGSTILAAAEPHCGCRWLIKLDVRRFFESISEIAAHRVFLDLGYQPLVAFELARLCSRMGATKLRGEAHRWSASPARYAEIPSYRSFRVGHIPQGAPTSPMLSNLAMRDFDAEVTGIADRLGLTYTRYADDLCLSTRDPGFTRASAAQVIGEVCAVMGRHGLSPNIAKTHVAPPGARKIVLGLLVDTDRPRLPREFRDRLRQHLHFVTRPDIGPARHAAARGFTSVHGLRDHLLGLVSFAGQVDPAFASECRATLDAADWPF